jgi:CPA2 family monovalent cation:H+ antiporter-2
LKKITLQQLELNKEELIGKSISESHIREKKRMVWWYRTKREKATESGTDLILQKNDILWG